MKFAHSLLRCGWLFTLGLLMFDLSLVDLLSLQWSPRTNIDIFLFLLKVSFEGLIQNLQKNSGWFKIWMGFIGPILIKLGTSSIWVFLNCLCDVLFGVTNANMLVTTQWPLKRAAHLISLAGICVAWRSESLMELSALWVYLNLIRG